MLILDTAGSADSAVAAYQQAVAAGADQVLGPLDRDAVTALFALEQHPLPMLALNRSGLPPPPGSASYALRSEEHTSELQSLMRISYAVFCLTKKTKTSTK